MEPPEDIANYIFWLALGGIFLTLSLMIALFLRDRKAELGDLHGSWGKEMESHLPSGR